MNKFFHSVYLDSDKCTGCITCLKRCPTQAIRVRDGKAHIINEFCIDCGECIRVCPHHAKKARYAHLSVLEGWKYKIAIPAPALFGQFKELFVVNYLRWTARHKGMPFPSDAELMRILKKNNVYVLGEIKQNAANWDNRRVFNILGLLREYDAKSKGMNAGGASDGELLRELLLKIFLL